MTFGRVEYDYEFDNGNKAKSNSAAGNFIFLFSEGIDNATQQKKVYLIFLHFFFFFWKSYLPWRHTRWTFVCLFALSILTDYEKPEIQRLGQPILVFYNRSSCYYGSVS